MRVIWRQVQTPKGTAERALFWACGTSLHSTPFDGLKEVLNTKEERAMNRVIVGVGESGMYAHIHTV